MRDAKIMQASTRQEIQARSNLRLGLALAAMALAFFFGYILRAWWLGP